jgi:hypothetical protein
MQEHQNQYPRIFRLAMDIIPIQASSVPCERVFSSGKQTMSPRRGRISAQLMEALQILKFSIRKENLKFSDMTWKEELETFELLARSAPPGDAEAYGRSLDNDDEVVDSDNMMDELDEQETNTEVLGEQLMKELEINQNREDDDAEDLAEDIYI